MKQNGSGVNDVKEQMYDCGFLEALEQMNFPTDQLYHKADEFVEKHFGYADEYGNDYYDAGAGTA